MPGVLDGPRFGAPHTYDRIELSVQYECDASFSIRTLM